MKIVQADSFKRGSQFSINLIMPADIYKQNLIFAQESENHPAIIINTERPQSLQFPRQLVCF